MDNDMKETEMTVENLTHRIRETVEKYISQEECYGDDTQLRIDTTTLDIDLADPEDDLPECDYYPVMDLVRGSDTEPGKWIPDMDAIQEIVTEYLQA